MVSYSSINAKIAHAGKGCDMHDLTNIFKLSCAYYQAELQVETIIEEIADNERFGKTRMVDLYLDHLYNYINDMRKAEEAMNNV